MQSTLRFNPCQFSSQRSVLSNPSATFNYSKHKSLSVPNPSAFGLRLAITDGMRKFSPTVCARKKKRRASLRRSGKLMLELVSIIASNLNILPQPLDLVIREFGGANGGGGGMGTWKGFGGGGFDRWRRKRKRSFLPNGFFIILGLIMLFGTDLQIDVVCGIMGFFLFGTVFIQWAVRSGVRDSILGICISGILLGLGLRRVELQKWVERIRISYPMMKIAKKCRSRRVF